MDQPEKKRIRVYPSLVGPVILVAAGVLLLLSYLDLIEVNLWQLWRLWPVLLILLGLDLLLSRWSRWGRLLMLLVSIVVVGGLVAVLVVSPGTLGTPREGGVDFVKEPLDDVESAALALDMGAGELKLIGLEDSDSLVEGTLHLRTGREAQWEIERSAGQAKMSLKDRGRGIWIAGQGDEWDLALSPKVGFDLNIDVGAGRSELDLTGLDVRDLTVNASVGQVVVVLPGDGSFEAKVDGGVGRLVIKIPESLAARVHMDRGLSAVDVSSRFERDGDVYVTEDWESSDNRVEVLLDMGVGQVTIREP